MGTPFETIYEYAKMVVNDYHLDAIYIKNKEIFFTFFRGLLISGIPDFDCLTSLDFEEVEEEINIDDKTETVKRYYFIEKLSRKEISILSKILVAQYFKGKVQDVLAYEPQLSKREFKNESIAQGFKQKQNWYKELVSEYVADIKDYNMENLDKLPFWGDM